MNPVSPAEEQGLAVIWDRCTAIEHRHVGTGRPAPELNVSLRRPATSDCAG